MRKAFVDMAPDMSFAQRAAVVAFMRNLDPKFSLPPSERRAIAVPLLVEGAKPQTVAAQLGISRTTLGGLSAKRPRSVDQCPKWGGHMALASGGLFQKVPTLTHPPTPRNRPAK